MSNNIFKYMVPVVSGTIVAGFLTSFGERIIGNVFPLNVDMHNQAQLAAALATFPIQGFLALLLNFAIASITGGIVATLTSGRKVHRPALFVGGILTLMGIANDIMMPQPMWFSIVNLFVYLPMAYCGYLLTRKPEIH